MSLKYAPTLAESLAMNYTCPVDHVFNDATKYTNPCPTMTVCVSEQCMCGAIWLPSNDNFPDCTGLSDNSIFPFIVQSFNVLLWSAIFLYNLRIVYHLISLKEFAYNPVTQALIFSAVAGFAGVCQVSLELVGMNVRSKSYHESYYRSGTGTAAICLVVIGSCITLSDLAIPLLWLQIASSGMNKADAAKNKVRMEKMVNRVALFFTVTFFAVALLVGTASAAMYSFLWIFAILVAFNIGSRRLRQKLDSSGEVSQASINIRNYVRMITVSIALYVIFALAFILRPTEDAKNWWWSALLVYTCLGLCIASNTYYIRMSLDKKLQKMRLGRAGKVIPSELRSTKQSSAASTNEDTSTKDESH